MRPNGEVMCVVRSEHDAGCICAKLRFAWPNMYDAYSWYAPGDYYVR